MEQKKKSSWMWVIKLIAITLGIMFTTIIAMWIYLVGIDEYSRAEIIKDSQQKFLRNHLLLHTNNSMDPDILHNTN